MNLKKKEIDSYSEISRNTFQSNNILIGAIN